MCSIILFIECLEGFFCFFLVFYGLGEGILLDSMICFLFENGLRCVFGMFDVFDGVNKGGVR